MSFIDELLTRVQGARHLDGPTKAVVSEFLTAQRPVLERLEPAIVEAFFAALQQGDSAGAWDLVVGHLDQEELRAILRQAGAELEDLVPARQEAVAQYQAFIQALGRAALQLLSGMVLSVL